MLMRSVVDIQMESRVMSTYTVQLLVSEKVPDAPEGMRSVRLGWKTRKASGTALSPNRYVHVEKMADGLWDLELVDEVRGYLDGIFFEKQNTFIHDLVSSRIEDGTFDGMLSKAEIGLDAMIQAEKAARKGVGKISASVIEEWFQDELLLQLEGYIKEKMPQLQDAEVIGKLENYMKYFSQLSSTTRIHQIPLARKLYEVLPLTGNREHRIYKFVEKKLEDMSREKTEDDFGI